MAGLAKLGTGRLPDKPVSVGTAMAVASGGSEGGTMGELPLPLGCFCAIVLVLYIIVPYIKYTIPKIKTKNKNNNRQLFF